MRRVNYDGKGGTFGDQGLATATTLGHLSAFAAQRTADGKVTVMMINRSASPRTVKLQLESSSATTLAVYSIASGASAISMGTDVSASGDVFSATPAGQQRDPAGHQAVEAPPAAAAGLTAHGERLERRRRRARRGRAAWLP